MGCDIHSIARVKINNTWEIVGTELNNDSRDYDLFSVLADVRNPGNYWPVLYHPRGLPLDLITKENICYWEVLNKECEFWLGDHSHSYLTLKELKQIRAKFRSKEKREFLRGLDTIIDSLTTFGKKLYKVKNTEIQFVFGFDS